MSCSPEQRCAGLNCPGEATVPVFICACVLGNRNGYSPAIAVPCPAKSIYLRRLEIAQDSLLVTTPPGLPVTMAVCLFPLLAQQPVEKKIKDPSCWYQYSGCYRKPFLGVPIKIPSTVFQHQ